MCVEDIDIHIRSSNLIKCLTKLSPDCNRDLWIKALFAAHSVGVCTKPIFIEWSKNGAKWDRAASKCIDDQYRKGDLAGGITLGTLIKEVGGIKETPSVESIPKFSNHSLLFTAGGTLGNARSNAKEATKINKLKDQFKIQIAGGASSQVELTPPRALPGEIRQWPVFASLSWDIYDKAPHKYPEISMLVALQALSNLVGKACANRVNLYSIYAIPTGGGKAYYIKKLRQIMERIDYLVGHEEGTVTALPGSERGFRTMLEEQSTRCITSEEVFKSVLTSGGGDEVSINRQDLIGCILDLYSNDRLEASYLKDKSQSYDVVEDIAMSFMGCGTVTDLIGFSKDKEALSSGLANRFIIRAEFDQTSINTKYLKYNGTKSYLNIYRQKPLEPNVTEKLDAVSRNVARVILDEKDSVRSIECEDVIRMKLKLVEIFQKYPEGTEKTLSVRYLENAMRVAEIIACTEALYIGADVVPQVSLDLFTFCFQLVANLDK